MAMAKPDTHFSLDPFFDDPHFFFDIPNSAQLAVWNICAWYVKTGCKDIPLDNTLRPASRLSYECWTRHKTVIFATLGRLMPLLKAYWLRKHARKLKSIEILNTKANPAKKLFHERTKWMRSKHKRLSDKTDQHTFVTRRHSTFHPDQKTDEIQRNEAVENHTKNRDMGKKLTPKLTPRIDLEADKEGV